MEIKHKINFKKVPFFKELSSEEILFILPYLEENNFAEGEIVLPQGGPGGDLYLLISGLVSVDIILPGDYHKRLATLGKNEIFGEVTFLSETLVTASVVAIRPCVCIVFHHKLLEILRASNPEIAFKIEKEIAHHTANRITSNINDILKILNTIPQELQSHEYASYLENSFAYSRELNIKELDLNHVKKLSFFKRMSKTQITELLPLIKVKSYSRGYRFLANDKDLNKIGVVYSGAVMFFIKENEQLKKSIAITAIGELFLQNFIFPEFRQIADYVTCEKCVILELDINVYQQLHHSHPTLFYIISESINRAITGSVYIANRQFVRINSEYNNIIS